MKAANKYNSPNLIYNQPITFQSKLQLSPTHLAFSIRYSYLYFLEWKPLDKTFQSKTGNNSNLLFKFIIILQVLQTK
jgi:hypothetical protein